MLIERDVTSGLPFLLLLDLEYADYTLHTTVRQRFNAVYHAWI